MTVRQQVLAKPPVVQEMLKIIATHHGLDESREVFNDSMEAHFQHALELWGRMVAGVAGICSEVQLAEVLIYKLRTNPEYGWSNILRKGANA